MVVQHSSTLTHRTIKPPGLFKQYQQSHSHPHQHPTKQSQSSQSNPNHSLRHSSSLESNDSSSNSIENQSSGSNTTGTSTSHTSSSSRRGSTPLSSIANKFGKWKRRMSNGSSNHCSSTRSSSRSRSFTTKSTPTKKIKNSSNSNTTNTNTSHSPFSSMTSKNSNKGKYPHPRKAMSRSTNKGVGGAPVPEMMHDRGHGNGSHNGTSRSGIIGGRSSSRNRSSSASRRTSGLPKSSSIYHPSKVQAHSYHKQQQQQQQQHQQHQQHMLAHGHGQGRPHSSTQTMYDQVVDGMSKMSSYEKDEMSNASSSNSSNRGAHGHGHGNGNGGDDKTTATASITMASHSHSHHGHSLVDDGSTIVSELTTDSSYNFHTFSVGDKKFTVDRRYSKIRTVGSGAYGVVISAKDFTSNTNVAIKMVPRAFHDEVDAKRILREIKLLKHFDHENIIGILDMMPPLARHVEDFKDVYIVTDLMETDLHRIIYSKQSLSLEHVQYFLYQILRAVKYLHSANVLHRDLKPSNLLVNSNCDLKVCDFGLARGITPNHDQDLEENNGGSMLLTEYVVTRWYRAPEIMLACHEYSKPVDIWSAGCIFAELLHRKPYLPGDDYIDQLTLIAEKLGKPTSEEEMDFITSEKAKRFLRKLPHRDPMPLRDQFPTASPEAIDLLGKMLTVHPRHRIKIEEALAHPFFASLLNPDAEPVAHAPFDFTFEDEELHRVRLQELIWEEVGQFRPSCLPVPRRMNVIPASSSSNSSSGRYRHA